MLGKMLVVGAPVLVVAAVVAVAIAEMEPRREVAGVRASLTVRAAMGANTEGFARAVAPRKFHFPADHGPHREFATEWWYLTGNLETAQGRHFGFQFTIFRQALRPPETVANRASKWAASEVYLGHLTLGDTATGEFHVAERFERGALGLAGAVGETAIEPWRVWLDDWRMQGTLSNSLDTPTAPTTHETELPRVPGFPARVVAAHGDWGIAVEFVPEKPPVFPGDHGLSQKGPEPGDASHYYSLTRLATAGTVRVGGQEFAVTGRSWLDREWSTASMGGGIVGWDWFALQLSDGRDLMLYRLRHADGSVSPFSSGLVVAVDGTSHPLGADDVTLTVRRHWHSPVTGGTYPAGWTLAIPGAKLNLEISPTFANQELPVTVRYWEGAVTVTGFSDATPISGRGFAELTGYADGPAARHR